MSVLLVRYVPLSLTAETLVTAPIKVAEETGYNLNGKIDPESVIEMEIKEQQISLFVVPGVPEEFPFETKTRKEISKIEWFKLADLPTWKRNKAVPGKFYLISPFIGPLKAFINEHKPRKPLRRTQRTRDLRPKQEFADESDASVVEFHSRPATRLDASAQESSSQTSSADNGDPQTPSPLYSEAVVTRVDVAQGTECSALDAKAVDPHFARLLSALTLSAKPNGDGGGGEKVDYAPPANAAALPPPVSPTPGDAAVPHERLQTRAAPTSSTVVTGDPAATAHTWPPSKLIKQSSTAALTNDGSRLDNPLPGSHVLPPLPTNLSTSISGLSKPQSPSAKSPTHSRGSSMITADLSPYLARPAGIPINGKRLKQLALLEAVANESSRRTPALSMRPATQPQLPPHEVPPVPSLPPFPPNTAMPHHFTNLSPMYSNIHGPYFPPIPQTGHFNPSPPDNAFVVRPRTSNSFRPVSSHPPRPFITRGSMNQAQLLSALSGTSNPSPGFHRPPITPMPNFQGSITHPLPSIPSVVTGAPIFRTGLHPPADGRGLPPPLRALPPHAISEPVPAQGLLSTPAGSPNIEFTHATSSSQNSHLLSILNRGPGR
ncbi:hypothetical protein B0F90DRAFT_1813518 [Multifurca ochricompacta]|uniref:Uncharacterized protein n=1 Tax=Multifurca ochricompacta TaxID=376703 RepID=A0AAD4ME85_9AGAM|nr:hypothetical protein B0F90DRAFT_1813518 [Multifurca ochricompacta]